MQTILFINSIFIPLTKFAIMNLKKLLPAFLLFHFISGNAQDSWKVTASDINSANYYGVTVANGMILRFAGPNI